MAIILLDGLSQVMYTFLCTSRYLSWHIACILTYVSYAIIEIVVTAYRHEKHCIITIKWAPLQTLLCSCMLLQPHVHFQSGLVVMPSIRWNNHYHYLSHGVEGEAGGRELPRFQWNNCFDITIKFSYALEIISVLKLVSWKYASMWYCNLVFNC
jgi:hypothetical protein